MNQTGPTDQLAVRQLFDTASNTYTYLLVDMATHEGAIVDGVREQFARDLQLIEELGIELLYVLETHVHADHISSAGMIRQHTGTGYPSACTGAHSAVASREGARHDRSNRS